MKIFYDHLIEYTEIELGLKDLNLEIEEKEEISRLVDEIIHHKILGCILDNLPSAYHEEFLEKFYQAPYDESHLDWLREKIGQDVEEIIRREMKKLKEEILESIKTSSSPKKK